MGQRRVDIGRELKRQFVLLQNDKAFEDEDVDWARSPAARKHFKYLSRNCKKVDLTSYSCVCWMLAYVSNIYLFIALFLLNILSV